MTAAARRADPRMQAAIAAVVAFGLLFSAGAALLWGARTALSVGAGALLAASNLWVLTRIVSNVLGNAAETSDEPPGGGGGSVWGVLAVVKMLVLFGGVWILMTKGVVDPIPLVVGYGSMPIGIAIGSLVSDKTARRVPPAE
jgi:hypothetical protein